MPAVVGRGDEAPAVCGPGGDRRPALPFLREAASLAACSVEDRDRRLRGALGAALGARRRDRLAIRREDRRRVIDAVGLAEEALLARLEVDERDRRIDLAVARDALHEDRELLGVFREVERRLDGELTARLRRQVDAVLARRIAGDEVRI